MRILVLLAALVGLTGQFESAYACTCIGTEYDEDQFRATDLLFKGVALKTEGDGQFGSRTEFRANQTIKGVEASQRIIRQPYNSCSRGFEEGKEYWVRAHRVRGEYETGMCLHLELEADLARNSEDIPRAYQSFADAETEEARQDAARKIQKVLNRRDFLQFLDIYPNLFEFSHHGDSPDDPYAWRSLAKRAKVWRDVEREASAWEGLIGLEPDNPDVHVSAAKALTVLGNYSQTIDHLEKAINLDAKLLEAQHLLARARLLGTGEFDKKHIDYRNLDIRGIMLQGRPPEGVDFSNSVFEQVDAKDTMLHGARFRNAGFFDSDFSGAHLENADLRDLPNYMRSSASNFTRAHLRHADLSGAFFLEHNLEGVDLTGAIGVGVSFEEANLSKAILSKSDFRDAMFRNSDLNGITVDGADFRGSIFPGTRLLNVDFGAADTRNANFHSSLVNCATRLPDKVNYAAMGVIPVESICEGVPQNRKFTDVVWHGIDLSGLDLSGADFSGSRLQQISFRDANLEGASFRKTFGERFYSGADLTNADFSDAGQVGFHGEHIDEETGTVLVGYPILDRAIFDRAQLSSHNFISVWPQVTPFANLASASFEGATLTCFWDRLKYLERDRRWVLKRHSEGKLTDEELEKKLLYYDKQIEHENDVFEVEGELVKFLGDQWPSVKFDESCSRHFDDRLQVP